MTQHTCTTTATTVDGQPPPPCPACLADPEKFTKLPADQPFLHIGFTDGDGREWTFWRRHNAGIGDSPERARWLMYPATKAYLELAGFTPTAEAARVLNELKEAHERELGKARYSLNAGAASLAREINAKCDLRDKLEIADKRVKELEEALRGALDDWFEEETDWLNRACALLGDERLTKIQHAKKTQEVVQAALNSKAERLEAAEQQVKELTDALGLLVAALDLDRIEVVCEGKHVFKARQRANAVLADAMPGEPATAEAQASARLDAETNCVDEGEKAAEGEPGTKCEYCKRYPCGAAEDRDDPKQLRICRHATRLERDFLKSREGRLEGTVWQQEVEVERLQAIILAKTKACTEHLTQLNAAEAQLRDLTAEREALLELESLARYTASVARFAVRAVYQETLSRLDALRSKPSADSEGKDSAGSDSGGFTAPEPVSNTVAPRVEETVHLDTSATGEAKPLNQLLGRDYNPPQLLIAEEVELGSGYHTLHATSAPPSDWSEPYKKSSNVQYRRRVVRVPYPPVESGEAKPAESCCSVPDVSDFDPAEGRRLLQRWDNYAGTARGIISASGSGLAEWLWKNREALISAAETIARQEAYADEPDGYDSPTRET